MSPAQSAPFPGPTVLLQLVQCAAQSRMLVLFPAFVVLVFDFESSCLMARHDRFLFSPLRFSAVAFLSSLFPRDPGSN